MPNEFIKEQFDKMLLFLLICIFLGVMVWAGGEQNFAQRTIDILTGALVGIITGKYMAKNTPPPATA